jgi:rhodanese-related sulfurtransferase
VSTVAEEKRWNPRLGEGQGEDAFVALMEALDLPYPQRIDEALPANMASGITQPEPAVASDAEADRWAPVLRTASGVPVIEAEWLAEYDRELHLVDVREPMEFRGAMGHLEGAELVPMVDLERVAAGWDRRPAIVTICAYGTRSGKAADILGELGFERVASLHGGMVRWSELGLPVVAGEQGSQEASFLGMDI